MASSPTSPSTLPPSALPTTGPVGGPTFKGPDPASGNVRQLHVVIIGATSAIAFEVARLYADIHAKIHLVARDAKKLESVTHDLTARGAQVSHHETSLGAVTDLRTVLTTAVTQLGHIDIVLIAHGTLPDAEASREEADQFCDAINVNFMSAAYLAERFADHMVPQGSGTVAVIGSVAGDRGRKSNYLYGSAKGGLSIFLAGLRNRVFAHGINVLTIKPGFVDTPMTSHIKKGPLFATPDRVAKDIFQAIKAGKEEMYTPWFWWPIMTIIKSIPEKIFKRLSL